MQERHTYKGVHTMVDTQKVGAFIAQCRKEHNWTQKELGEKLGVTDKAVSKWENGVSHS